MRVFCALAAFILVAGCRRSDTVDRLGDTVVTPPVSPDSSASDGARSCGIAGKPVITDGGIGELKVGRTVGEIRELCEVASDGEELGAEGMKERVIIVRIAGAPVRAVIVDDKVWRVEVTTSRILTADSLGVDTHLSVIASRRGARFLPGEDGVYGFVADHCALSFRFSVPMRPPAGRDWTAAAIDSAHGDASVNKVLITQCRR